MKRQKVCHEAEESFIQAMADADTPRPCGACGGIVNGVIGSSCDCDKPSREELREGLAKLICDTYYEEERFDSELRAEKDLWRMAADAILARYVVLTEGDYEKRLSAAFDKGRERARGC